MKRTLAVILSLVIICGLFVCESSVNAKTNTAKYKSKVVKAIESCQKCGDYYIDRSSVGGFLYDFDGNGVKELVLSYFKTAKINNYPCPFLVCSVYTIKKGKVKTLINAKKLYADAGGPFAAVGAAKKNGKKYLFCYDETGETGGGKSIRRSGEIVLYKIKGTKAVKYKKAKYTIRSNTTKNPPKVLKTGIKINSKKTKYKTFLNWQKAFKLYKAKRYKGGYWKYSYSSKYSGLYTLLDKFS